MNYNITKLDNKNLQIEISLDKKEWDADIEAAYNKNKSKFNIVGFRKGKAPRKVIEKTYGENVFYEDALSDSFYKYYMDILEKEKDIQPVDSPSLTIKDISADGVTILAEVVVMPEIKLNKYTGFKVDVKPAEITDKDVDAELKKVAEQNIRLIEVKRAIKKSDVVNINFSGSVDGKKFDGGTAENYDLEIGSHSFIDTFEDQLTGLKEGDEKDVKVSFPKDYQAQNLAGKPAVFKVKVNSVKEKQYPEINDELASNVSEFDKLDEYKADIKKNLIAQADEKARVETENKIIDKVIESMEVEIPDVMVEQELDHIMKDIELRLMYQGLNLETYAKYFNTTAAKLREERKTDALKGVKIRLALQYIIEKENLTLTDDEVEDKIKEMAKSAKKSVKEFKDSLDEHRLSHIKNDILMDKLIKFLVENNK